mmetsp:Transcript_14854/g.21606  ORF Transcript_14854/g.21606 Transcript_14854/m.21606 type:complete len:213 (-) Transcript_14854:40-678(-)
MSDIEDWEKLAEEEDEAIEKMIESQQKFADEKEAPPKPEPQQPAPKTKKKKKNIGQAFEKKQEERKQERQEQVSPQEQKLRQKQLEEEADHKLTDELFEVSKVEELKTEEDYVNYAAEISRVLLKGKAHYRLPVFLKELIKETSEVLNSNQISDVMAAVNVTHKEKLKKEKGPAKKKSNKQALKGVDRRGQLVGPDDDLEIEDEYGEFDDFL